MRSKPKHKKLQGVAKQQRIAKSGAIRKDAHISSRNKRDQAKIDNRPDASQAV